MKYLTIMALGALLLAPLFTVSAAMPNFTGSGYKQAAQCTSSDLPIYENVSGQNIITGCTPRDAMERATARAKTLQSTGYKFGAGEAVVRIDGTIERCPWWYQSGCVIPREFVR